jgi:DNA repair exonuclease SbcCD ATPase subunit
VSISLLDENGDNWVVVRERRKNSPNINLICPDGCDFKGDKAHIQSKIEQLLGLDFLTFRSSVMYGQNDTNRFIRPETSDTDRKAVLHKILGTELLADCCLLARKKKKDKQGEITELDFEIEKNKVRLSSIDLDELESLESKFYDEIEEEAAEKLSNAKEYSEKAKKTLKELKKIEGGFESGRDIEEIKKEIIDLKKEIKKKKDKKIQNVQTANDRLSVVQGEMNKCSSSITKLVVEYDNIENQLKKLDGDKCSVCNSVLSKGDAAKYIKNLKVELQNKKSEIKKIEIEKDKLEERLSSARQNCRVSLQGDSEVEEIEDRFDGLNSELRDKQSRASRFDSEKQILRERIKNYKELAKRSLLEREVIQNKENHYTAMLVEAREKEKKINKELNEIKLLKDEKVVELSLLEFWVKGFSNQGLPSFMLDSVVPYITERANYYLGILSDHDIKINLSTQIELKSGERRDKIDVAWEIEGAKDYPPSGGQWKKMEIAVDLALMDLVGNRSNGDLGFLALDEILDGLDAESRNRVVDLLEHLKKQKETIFVITHDPDVSDVFEQSIVVEKTDGVSSLRRVG